MRIWNELSWPHIEESAKSGGPDVVLAPGSVRFAGPVANEAHGDAASQR